MSGGDIASIIAASAFALLVIFIGVPLIKMGRLLDEARDSVHDLNSSVAPLLTELTTTVTETNKQLARLDVITENVAGVTTTISSMVETFSSAIGGPLVKIAGITKGLSSALLGKKNK